eukprot:2130156-Pyramimonas_sp.AAC.1
MQTIVQRGLVNVLLMDLRLGKSVKHIEPWVCKPKKVRATSAEAIFPAIVDAMPGCFNPLSLEALVGAAKGASSFTLCLVCDRASSNLLVLKRVAKFWEVVVLPLIGPR